MSSSLEDKKTFNPRQIAIFDWDGIIVDSPRLYFQAHRIMARELGTEFTIEQQRALISDPIVGKSSIQKFLELLDSSYRNTPPEKLAIFEAKRDEIYQSLLSANPASVLKPEIDRLMRVLKGRGCDLAISSTAKRVNLDAIFNSQLRINPADFATITTRESITDYMIKRDKLAINRQAITSLTQALGRAIDPSECMIFEDSVWGVNAAKQTGIGLVIAVPDEQTIVAARTRLADLPETFGFWNADIIVQSLGYLADIWQ